MDMVAGPRGSAHPLAGTDAQVRGGHAGQMSNGVPVLNAPFSEPQDQATGLTHPISEKRAKSVSAEYTDNPCSIARAAN